ncbi:MAG: HAD family phosphatase [Candidatus Azobacteroides sp.]|nr:HAD family phosphatase [Candidatus Azobacteroides sp.]
MKKKNFAFLFDLDGVLIDSESQYDRFWHKVADDYHLGIESFEYLIKGTTLPNILTTYFSHLSPEEQEKLAAANRAFELQMDILPIPGALELLEKVKKEGIQTGLVTSSDDEKLQYVLSKLPIRSYFDTIVSANRITDGKPHPMCFLLAAQDLNVLLENCFVFEDSFNGIRSGNAAGMQVIGLSTTNSVESIQNDCIKVIPNFRNFDFRSLFL